jgi:hypothetical protein
MALGVAAVLTVVGGSSTGRSQTAALPADQQITFSAVKVTQGQDPHAYGIKLDLWKRAGAWVGFISEYTGFIADPPAGRLDGLQIDEAAGKIAFTAKLSLGMTTAKGTNAWVRTKDVYEFAGTIDKDTIAGVLSKRQADDPPGRTTKESVALRRQPRDSADDTSYDQWIRTWTLILQARGPKW